MSMVMEAGRYHRESAAPDHRFLAAALVLLVGLAPLPLGGNRPVLWPMWTSLVAIIAIVYSSSLVLRGGTLAVSLRRLAPPLTVVSVLCLYLVAQTLPIAPWMGLGRLDVGGVSLSIQSISLTPGQTLLMAIRWLGYGLTFFLMAQVSFNRARAVAVLEALYIVILIYGVLGIVSLGFLGDTLLGLEKWAYQGVATATFVNRNSYATFLAFGFAIGTALAAAALADKDGRRRSRGTMALYASGQGVLLAALLLSGSRMGLFAAVVAGIVVLVLALWGRASRAGVALPLLLVAAVAGLALLLLFGGRLIERLNGLEDDAENRFELYRQVWGMIQSRPWTGFGGGSFEQAFQLFHVPPLSADVVWDKAHSSYLTLAAELGLPAAILVIAALGASVVGMAALLRDPEAGRRVPLAIVGVAIVAALHSLVDFSLEIQANAYLFAALLGMGFGYRQRVQWHGEAHEGG